MNISGAWLSNIKLGDTNKKMILNQILKLFASLVFLLLGGGFFYKFILSSSSSLFKSKKPKKEEESSKTNKSDRNLLDILQQDDNPANAAVDDKEKISLFDYLTEIRGEQIQSSDHSSSMSQQTHDQQLISDRRISVDINTPSVEPSVEISIEEDWEIVDHPNVAKSSPSKTTMNTTPSQPVETHLQVNQQVDSKRDSIELSVNQEEFCQVYKTVSSVLTKKHTPTIVVEEPTDSSHTTNSEEFDLAEEESAWTWTDVVSDEEYDEEEENHDEQDRARQEGFRDDFMPATCVSPSLEDKVDLIGQPQDEEELKLDEMKKMNEKRKNILSEILTTEEYYVKGLIILTGVYKKQIEQKKIVDPKILKIIFQDVEIVNNVNQNFLEELRKIYEKEKSMIRNLDSHQQQQVQSSLGELLNTYAHSFKLYSSYIAGYKKAAATFSEEKKKNKKLCKLLDSIKQLLKQQGERITNMESYLVTPIQRIRK